MQPTLAVSFAYQTSLWRLVLSLNSHEAKLIEHAQVHHTRLVYRLSQPWPEAGHHKGITRALHMNKQVTGSGCLKDANFDNKYRRFLQKKRPFFPKFCWIVRLNNSEQFWFHRPVSLLTASIPGVFLPYGTARYNSLSQWRKFYFFLSIS